MTLYIPCLPRSKHEQGLLKLDAGSTPNFSEERCNEIVEEIDRRIGNIFRECPENSVVMVVTGQGNTIDAMTKQVCQHALTNESGLLAFVDIFGTLMWAVFSIKRDDMVAGKQDEASTRYGAQMDTRG